MTPRHLEKILGRGRESRVLPERILLIDHREPLCAAWSETFASYDNVEVIAGDFFSRDADAMVSPANSSGIMDGA